MIRKGSPWKNEYHFMLVGRKYLNLIVSRKSIHEREDDTSNKVVDNLFDMWSRKIVFRKIFVQVLEIDTDSNGALFFVHRDNVRYPFVGPRKGHKK